MASEGRDLELAEQRAVIALEAPHRGDNLGRDAIGLLDTGKQCLMLLDLGDAVGNALTAKQALGKIEKGALEHALTGIAFDHRFIED